MKLSLCFSDEMAGGGEIRIVCADLRGKVCEGEINGGRAVLCGSFDDWLNRDDGNIDLPVGAGCEDHRS